MKSKLLTRGEVHIVLFDEFGNIKSEETVHNTVAELGEGIVADAMSDRAITLPSHMAIGTGSPSATALGTELDRNALTSTTLGTGANDNDVVYVGDWAAGDGTGTLTEAGIFNASSGPVMFSSTTFGAIVKAAEDTLKITWTITYNAV